MYIDFNLKTKLFFKLSSKLFMNTADIVSIPEYFLLIRSIFVKR